MSHTRENLHATIEEMQSSNEELKSTNEELLRRVNDRFVAARDYTQNIIETVREPLIVLDSGLRVVSANKSFYRTFQTEPREAGGKLSTTLETALGYSGAPEPPGGDPARK